MEYSYWRKRVLALCSEVEKEGKVVKRKVDGRKKRVEEVVRDFGLCMAKFQRVNVKSGVKRVEGYIEKLGKLRNQMYKDLERWHELIDGLQGYVARRTSGEVKISDYVGYLKVVERYRDIVEGITMIRLEFYPLDGYIKGALDFARAWFKEHKELEELVEEFEDVRREREKERLKGVGSNLGRTNQEVA